MTSSALTRDIRIVGIALAGSDGSPVVVFQSSDGGSYLPLTVDPFDAEIIIRDYIGEGEMTAVSWLYERLSDSPPAAAVLEMNDIGRPLIRFVQRRLFGESKHRLGLGEGVALVRRLSLRLHADMSLFDRNTDELDWLAGNRVFAREFLYLTPPQYASNIPVV